MSALMEELNAGAMRALRNELVIVGERIEKHEATIENAVRRHRDAGDSESAAMAKAYAEPEVLQARAEIRKLDAEGLRLVGFAERVAARRERARVTKAEALDPLAVTVARLRDSEPGLTAAQATLRAFQDPTYARERRRQREAA